MSGRKKIRTSWIIELEAKINEALNKKFPGKNVHVDLQGEYEILKELDNVGDKRLVLTSEIRLLSNLNFSNATQEEKKTAQRIITDLILGTEQR
ncbi:MAG: hypothetical protein NWF00_00410 [Candidatus Bathyarchaeota archaeon]|nr:hypothetical protein [Candidatus Bathyarchaeota archaeon]